MTFNSEHSSLWPTLGSECFLIYNLLQENPSCIYFEVGTHTEKRMAEPSLSAFRLFWGDTQEMLLKSCKYWLLFPTCEDFWYCLSQPHSPFKSLMTIHPSASSLLLHPLQETESTPRVFFFSEIPLNRLSRCVSSAFWIFKVFAISGSDTIFITNNSSPWDRKQQITSRSPISPGLRRCMAQTPTTSSYLLGQPASQDSCLPSACCLCGE